jgi:hypothetical protein
MITSGVRRRLKRAICNEWNVLKDQFGALVRDQSAHAETIEESSMLNFVAALAN